MRHPPPCSPRTRTAGTIRGEGRGRTRAPNSEWTSHHASRSVERFCERERSGPMDRLYWPYYRLLASLRPEPVLGLTRFRLDNAHDCVVRCSLPDTNDCERSSSTSARGRACPKPNWHGG